MYHNRVGLVLCETPANPTGALFDIRAIANVLQEGYDEEAHPIFAVDNTYAGIFQHPLVLGADVCLYSATKFLGGHADLIGGFLVGRNGRTSVVSSFVQGVVSAPFMNALLGHRTILGLTPSSEMAHKLFKHMETYVLRMRRQALVATIVASWLAAYKKVNKVYFPTLLTGADAELYQRQMFGPSSMIAFQLGDDTEDAAYRFLNGMKLIRLAVSLGFIGSLAEHPASMTHSDIRPEAQMNMGITPGLIRFSVGIEEPDDLITDLTQALAQV
jgi:methionine-gamma-lyase